MVKGTDEFDGYFLWLCSLIDADLDRYSELLYILYNMEYRWSIRQDESRATEGLMLRDEYYQLTDKEASWVLEGDWPCNVLEALIPLSRRMDDTLTDEYHGDRSRVWFWEFIENLGLRQYDNQHLKNDIYDACEYDVQIIVNRWLDRRFDFDGTGSIFPVPGAVGDQREISTIYQMYNYVCAKYAE